MVSPSEHFDIPSVEELKRKLQKDFAHLLSGVGKLRRHQIKLRVDKAIKPVAQPVNWTPFRLRVKVEEKLELVPADIIEPVKEPRVWVSFMVIIPKEKQNDIRICVDMWRVKTPNPNS